MNKLKPCRNEMCPSHDTMEDYNCGALLGRVTEQQLLYSLKRCPKYLPEKQETAWEMFNRLNRKYGAFFNLYVERLKQRHLYCHVPYAVLDLPEQEAIKIMQEIEKGLLNDIRQRKKNSK